MISMLSLANHIRFVCYSLEINVHKSLKIALHSNSKNRLVINIKLDLNKFVRFVLLIQIDTVIKRFD